MEVKVTEAVVQIITPKKITIELNEDELKALVISVGAGGNENSYLGGEGEGLGIDSSFYSRLNNSIYNELCEAL